MFIVYYIWQPGSCDSEYPYHLSATSLPDQNNSLNVDLCMSDRGGKSRITYCCAEHINVTVHNCFGEYFVYKLNERMESNAYGKVCLSESKTGSKFIHMPLVISSYGGSHAAIYGCFGMSTVWQQWDKIYLLCKRHSILSQCSGGWCFGIVYFYHRRGKPSQQWSKPMCICLSRKI